MARLVVRLGLFVALVVTCAHAAFYVPGVSPMSYSPGEVLAIRVNSLTSNQGVMPFNFYSVKTCKPSAKRLKKEAKVENIGEILWGDRIEPSEYFVEVFRNVSCRKVCAPLSYNAKEMKNLVQKIELQYRGNMVLDNLPVAQETLAGPRHPKVMLGYPLGVPKRFSPTKQTLINNHLNFRIYFNEPDIHGSNDEETYRIVGFYVSAYSVTDEGKCADNAPFSPEQHAPLSSTAKTITWTYGVQWIEEPDIPWATRWDVYLRGGENDAKIHWLSITNSLLILLFLSCLVAMIMLRALHRDFNRYNDPENEDEAQEETGWKMVHGDVFRAPTNPVLLSATLGSGVQLICMAVATLLFAVLGFLSPSNRGALLSAIILLFVLLGSLNGFTTARMLKMFKRQQWRNVFVSAVLLPGAGMAIYLGLNFVQWGKHASSAVPFTTLLLLFGLWFCVSIPLVFVGGAIGFRRPTIVVPVHVNSVPRLIPPTRWYMQKWVMIVGSGVLPFAAAFIELVYIMSSFWQGRVYYVFGFLALVAVIVSITAAEVAIVMVYFQLCSEDYHWWWRSFLLTASSGLHLFLYAIYNLMFVLTIRQPSSMVLYVGYMLMAALLFALFTGTIGFYAAFAFIKKIYSSIKID